MPNNPTVWALVLNGAAAVLYRVNLSEKRLEPLPLEPSQRDPIPAHRDRPARTFQSVGVKRGSGEDLHEAEKAVERRFILDVAQAVEAQAREGHCDALILACGPHCRGVARAVAPEAFWKKVTREVVGDHVKTAPSELYPIMAEALRFGRPPN
jgi:hypothetical protein